MKRDPVVTEYDELAQSYDSKWADYVSASTIETLRRLDLEPGARVLDVACGTGALLTVLEQGRSGVVTFGVDLSEKMLRVARSKLKNTTLLIQTQADSLPFAGACFDVVLSVSAFHYMKQPDQVLAEFGRVLKPSGRLVITDWCDDYFACKLCDLALRVFDRAHYRTYSRVKCEDLIRRAGFENVGVDKYKISWLWGLMTAQALKPAREPQTARRF